MAPSPPYVVFISHGSTDAWAAEQMKRRIEERTAPGSVSIFLDVKEIEGGDIFHDSIFPAIRKCDELLIYLTPESRKRDWVLTELGAALGVDIRVTAVVHRLSMDDLPDPLQGRKAFVLDDFDKYVEELANRIETHASS